MLRVTDRYILREVVPPFLLSLLVLTFVLMLPAITQYAEELIAKGANTWTVLQIMGMLLPQALAVTIPMASLLGVLLGLGRLSSDREVVAFQACGISVLRICCPILLLGLASSAVTCYVQVFALPDANQKFRELAFPILARQAGGDVRPRVFYDGLPNTVLYVRDVATGDGSWGDVFMADVSDTGQSDVYLARQGKIILNANERRAEIVLRDGARHRVAPDAPGTYEVARFEQAVIGLDPEAVFPSSAPQRGFAELTTRQLFEEADRMRRAGLSPHQPIMWAHRKFSIPVACLVFGLIGVAVSSSRSRNGRFASFAVGMSVVFVYYILMYGSEALAKGGLLSPHVAMWSPNAVLGSLGVGLLAWRNGSVNEGVRLPAYREVVPRWASLTTEFLARQSRRLFGASKGTPFNMRTLDWYVTRSYLRVMLITTVGLLGVFYVSTFVDMSDKLFKGQARGSKFLEYFWYATPQFAYFAVPVACLIAALVTIGLLTKNSELTVMKACGVSLYRIAAPIVLVSLVWSGLLLGLEETILARANRRAEALNQEIRSGIPANRILDIVNRKWIVAEDGSIYHYLSYEPGSREVANLSIYEFKEQPWGLSKRTHVRRATFSDEWLGHDVWTRSFDFGDVPSPASPPATSPIALIAFGEQRLPWLEPPGYFESERSDAELMAFSELRAHIKELSGSGFDVIRLTVDLHRKLSFPFVTLILTLIAIPFAVTIGPSGALYSVGVGIIFAFTSWTTISVFAAVGSAGLLAPGLAAWAPNLLFGTSALYLILRART